MSIVVFIQQVQESVAPMDTLSVAVLRDLLADSYSKYLCLPPSCFELEQTTADLSIAVRPFSGNYLIATDGVSRGIATATELPLADQPSTIRHFIAYDYFDGMRTTTNNFWDLHAARQVRIVDGYAPAFRPAIDPLMAPITLDQESLAQRIARYKDDEILVTPRGDGLDGYCVVARSGGSVLELDLRFDLGIVADRVRVEDLSSTKGVIMQKTVNVERFAECLGLQYASAGTVELRTIRMGQSDRVDGLMADHVCRFGARLTDAALISASEGAAEKPSVYFDADAGAWKAMTSVDELYARHKASHYCSIKHVPDNMSKSISETWSPLLVVSAYSLVAISAAAWIYGRRRRRAHEHFTTASEVGLKAERSSNDSLEDSARTRG